MRVLSSIWLEFRVHETEDKEALDLIWVPSSAFIGVNMTKDEEADAILDPSFKFYFYWSSELTWQDEEVVILDTSSELACQKMRKLGLDLMPVSS